MSTEKPTATTRDAARPSPPADPPAKPYLIGARATEDADRLTKLPAQKRTT
jgi:hypothetical protein